MSERRSLIHIAGLHFSGSSLLNLLLDTQPGIRGCGELYHLYEGSKDCFCSCGEWLTKCPIYGPMAADAVYDECASAYDCRVLVDASKILSRMQPRIPSDWNVCALVLSKTPHAWAYSHRSHLPRECRPLDELFASYLWTYRQMLEFYPRSGYSMITCTYEHFVADPASVVRRVCENVGIAFDPAALDHWWSTDTHVAGGNVSVLHQVRGDDAYFDASGKYRDKYHSIFLDDAWKDDKGFIQECLDAYRGLDNRCADIFHALGHSGVRGLMQEIEDAAFHIA